MFDGRFLQMMYQQWSDGQSQVANRWKEFAEFAARHNNTTAELMLEELKKYKWFNWGE